LPDASPVKGPSHKIAAENEQMEEEEIAEMTDN
jgi:hypothetical protein